MTIKTIADYIYWPSINYKFNWWGSYRSKINGPERKDYYAYYKAALRGETFLTLTGTAQAGAKKGRDERRLTKLLLNEKKPKKQSGRY